MKARKIAEWHPSLKPAKEEPAKRRITAAASASAASASAAVCASVASASAAATKKHQAAGKKKPKAVAKTMAQSPQPKKMKHADAIIISPFISTHKDKGRIGIQAKCKLADGSIKTVGIVGLHFHNSPNSVAFGKALLAKCKEGTLITKADIVTARDAMLSEEWTAHEVIAD